MVALAPGNAKVNRLKNLSTLENPMKHHRDNHHRLPTSKGGTNDPSNISRVKITEHRAYHQLFRNLLPQEVAAILTKTWIDPAYYLVAIPRQKSRKKVLKRNGKVYIQITIEVEK